VRHSFPVAGSPSLDYAGGAASLFSGRSHLIDVEPLVARLDRIGGRLSAAHLRSPKHDASATIYPNRVTEVYSHVAPEVELRLLNDLQRR
jgi:hypothetical protein